MDRREFIKKGLNVGFVLLLGFKRLFAKTHPELVAVKGKSYDENLRKAVNILGGIKKFIRKGDIVVLKPNIAWNRSPEMAANTNPDIVYYVAKMCRDAGAKEVIIFDRTCNNPYKTYKRSGIKDAAKRASAKMIYVNKVSNKLYKKVKIPNGKYLKETLVCKYILKADKVINIPVAKVHSSAGFSISLKNWMGTTGDYRGRWHFDLHNAIADYSSIMKPTLTIIDATRIMVKNGPTGGRKEYVKIKDTIIVSTDQVLADAYAVKKLFNKNPWNVQYLTNAQKLGVGDMRLSPIRIVEL